jgi:5-methylcytosine-specific restriction endonuclease McrA
MTPYQFARTCALTWLRLAGAPLPDASSALKIARSLGIVPDGPKNGHAKKAIVEWHEQAITSNRQEPTKLEDDFYNSQLWRKARYQALRNCNGRCTLCGTPPGKYSLHVDHIKPRSLRPDLALDPANLQVLCRDCNLGKSNTDSIDWRVRHRVEQVEGEWSDYRIGKMLDSLH